MRPMKPNRPPLLAPYRKTNSVAPTSDPNVLQEAANQVAQAAAKQLSDTHTQMTAGLPQVSKQSGANIGPAAAKMQPRQFLEPLPQQQQQQQLDFAQQENQFRQLAAYQALPPLPMRGPAIEATSLVQRLMGSGQPEAAMAVASAAGLHPAAVMMAAGGGQGGYSDAMVPYAPRHALLS